MVEIKRNPVGMPGSPEGGAVFDSRTNTTIAIWASDVSNATTGLKLWQTESKDAGKSWSTPHPLNVPRLLPSDVTDGSHLAPGGGLQLQAEGSKHLGRLLMVLILQSSCKEDVVIYSDDGGVTWALSDTRLPNNGEAQLAELGADHLLFDGRSSLPGFPRGLATSYDGGKSWKGLKFVHDTSSSTSCLASLLAVPAKQPAKKQSSTNNLSAISGNLQRPSQQRLSRQRLSSQRLFFSHPAQKNRSQGVVLTSDDGAATWQLLASATPEQPSAMFAYSSLTALLEPVVTRPFARATKNKDGAAETEVTEAQNTLLHTGYRDESSKDNVMLGLTYETGDNGCTAAASACRIMFRRMRTTARGGI
jgi:hypothetical protein